MRPLPNQGRRILIAVGIAAALAVFATYATTASQAASTTAAQIQYAPTNTVAPTISGTPQSGQTLTASPGTWTSASSVTYAYQWQRCNSSGASCISVAGATAQTYAVTTADVGTTLRVVVTATNTDGSSIANSAATAVVTAAGPAGATKESNGRTSVPVSSISLPDRLVVDQVQFTPNPVRASGTITARFHVTDTVGGYDIRDAPVYALGLPYSRVTNEPEVQTGADGWATLQFQPGRYFPVHGYVTFFVRARKPGENPLAGVSTRRLVQLTINR